MKKDRYILMMDHWVVLPDAVETDSIPKSTVFWTVDPLNKYPNAEDSQLLEALGFIPTFLDGTAENVVETALEIYGFNLGDPMTGCVITADGVMQYPGDPDQYPIATCQCRDQTVCVYQYGIISFVDAETKESVTYRFD